MNPVKTPERVREVKNIVDALYHKAKRMEAEGNYYHLLPKLKKKEIWDMILSADNPEEAYQRMIGTKENPGTLRQALPSLANREGGYTPKINAKGESYAPAAEKVVEAFHEEARRKRNKNYEEQRRIKAEEFEQPEWMEDEEYEGIIDNIAADGGALREERLPEYGTYNPETYITFSVNVGNVDFYIDNYMEAWVKYGYLPYSEELTRILETIKKLNPTKLIEIFNSGDRETEVDFIYDLYKILYNTQRSRKGNKIGHAGYNIYINGMERIMNYWRKKLEEVQNDFE